MIIDGKILRAIYVSSPTSSYVMQRYDDHIVAHVTCVYETKKVESKIEPYQHRELYALCILRSLLIRDNAYFSVKHFFISPTNRIELSQESLEEKPEKSFADFTIKIYLKSKDRGLVDVIMEQAVCRI